MNNTNKLFSNQSVVSEGKMVRRLFNDPINNENGLLPYEGEWGFEQAAHLIRRTTFAPTPDIIKQSTELGLDASIDLLFEAKELPAPPVNPVFEEDPYVPVGESWVDAIYLEDRSNRRYRWQSLYGWIYQTLLDEGFSIREKLTLFWHNHFAVSNVNDPTFMYNYFNTLRVNACGNFKELVKLITIDPAMLRFLNGNQNTEKAPNENFARELLELYTVGKGQQVGPGDYSTFTEHDVVEISKVLTGWDDTGYLKKEEAEIGSFFIPEKHDTSTKQLSERFNFAVIEDQGEAEYSFLIDILFEQYNTAKYICTKLYRWFVYYEFDENTDKNIIDPLAQLLIESNFEIKPVIITLLKSQHFYTILNQGPMIKNPLDFTISALKLGFFELPETLNEKYFLLLKLYNENSEMEMIYHKPPEVAGWKAYYKAPFFNRTWINATTMVERMKYTDRLAQGGLKYAGIKIQANPFKLLEHISDPFDPNILVQEMALLLFPLPLEESQHLALKDILIPGLPDFEWTVEYGEYAADPENSDLAKSVETKLRNLLQALFTMAEFHLS